MHIPDNYLSPSTCAVMGTAMVPIWSVAVRKVRAEISRAGMPMLGVGAAFTFLIMMFNIPLPGGTTGHAVGGTLVATLLGPWAACIAISVALLIQALLFGDGGVLAFGANCFNMAFVLPLSGYWIYRFFKKFFRGKRGELTALAIGSWSGIVLAAFCAAVEFGIQPLLFHNGAGQPLYCPYPLSVAVPAMVIPHMVLAGFVEALFAVGIFSFISKVSPESIYQNEKPCRKSIYTLLLTLIALTPLGLLASGTAWGEWSTQEISAVIQNGHRLGFVPSGMQQGFLLNTLLPDYAVSGMPEVLGYLLSAVAGVSVLMIIFKVVGTVQLKE